MSIDSNQLLRFTTAGSVDDGKSTLIGRLLYDSKSIFEDQIASVEKTSKRRGMETVDLALFTDGLRDEREQGITIDVAYRYFTTPKRKFIIADTPGHHMTVGPPRHGVHAYDAATGTPIWSTVEQKLCDELNARCFPAASAPVTATGDLVFAGGLDATMRIYSAQSGDLLWSFDTMSDLETVNSVPAFGGSIDSAGPVLIGDKLIINSGYDKFRLLPGNALLVFELEEE